MDWLVAALVVFAFTLGILLVALAMLLHELRQHIRLRGQVFVRETQTTSRRVFPKLGRPRP